MVKILINNPKISFIIVNYNGKHLLEGCFNSLKKLKYPHEQIEIILVDNGSKDGSIEFVKNKFPKVKIIRNETNEGFAKPNNDAAKIAQGEYLALINNDMRLDENWLNDMLETLESCNDEKYVCVGSRILNWDGSKIDFIGGGINFYGFGYQDDYSIDVKTAEKKYTQDKDILFACGGAMLIDRKVYLEAGGLDEDYFAYYEDADFGWRLWILGYKVRLCVKATCYHKHNATSKSFNTHKKNLLFERNALYTVFKNYSDDNFKVVLATILLAANRMQKDLNINKEIFNINYKNNEEISVNIDENNFTTLIAMNEVLENIDNLIEKRNLIQSKRKVNDEDLSFLYSTPYVTLPLKYLNDIHYLEKVEKLISLFDINKIYKKEIKRRILLISNDRVGKKMAGPGIRYWEFAKELCNDNKVVLAIPNKVNIDCSDNNIELVEYEPLNPRNLAAIAQQSDIVILQGTILERSPELKEICKEKILIIDIYDPFVIENIEVYKHRNIEFRNSDYLNSLIVQNEQLELGDYFICASDPQMNMWIGMLTALNKVTPSEYDNASDLSRLIGIVPFGVSETEPIKTRDAMKEKIINFKPEDKVFIWGGGVWNWFDPITLIKAIGEISKERDDIKVFFLGVKHPNPAVPEMEMTNKAIILATELGIINKYVFFNMDWVDYDDRQNFLLNSYGGVSCHFLNLETRFSFRTRILDYLWARLPIVTTEGDFFANEVEKNKLGLVVKVEDVTSMKQALLKLSDDKEFYEECKKNIDAYRENYKWSVVTKPLKEFCKSPTKKPLLEKYNYIADIELTQKDGIIGELTDGVKVLQRFKCRYPNLASLDVMVATFDRVNSHKLFFKVYEGLSDTLIIEKEIEASYLRDNTWVEIKFDPIINSEGRVFYFTIETEGAKNNNCITIWKSNKEVDNSILTINNMNVSGNLCYKVKCIYSSKPLRNGFMLPMDYSQMEYGKMSINEIESMVSNIKSHKGNIGRGNVYKDIDTIKSNISNINSWIDNFDRKLKKVKKITMYDKIKKLFKR